jgi:hypothetical protein
MPLTREQTSYSNINNTVFLPTVAIDNNLGVRGSSVFSGPANFTNGLTVNSLLTIELGGGSNPNFIMRGPGEQTFRFHNTNTSGSTRVSWKMANRLNSDWSWIWYTDTPENGTNDLNLANLTGTALNIAADRTTTFYGNLVQNVNATAKTAAYQLTTADANTIVQMNGAFAFQVDTSLAVLPLGTTITLVAQTAGVTVATTATATVPTINATPGLKLRAAWSTASLIKMSAASASGTASTWLLTGDLTA